MKKIHSLTLQCLLICSLGLLITSCSGEDGPAGPAGTNGTNGTDGKNGTDGENGIGFEEITKYGNLTSRIKGKRIDNVDFDQTIEYKYARDNTQNSYYVRESGDTKIYKFAIKREEKSSKRLEESNTMIILMTVTDIGTTGQIIQEVKLYYENVAIVSDDLSFFTFNESFFRSMPGVSNFKITDLAFNETTNKLTFSYSFDVAGGNNGTGNPLSISGSVDVTLYQSLQDFI